LYQRRKSNIKNRIKKKAGHNKSGEGMGREKNSRE
jgi:hypothetical protein